MDYDIQGTQTERNILEAFQAEATSLVKYRLFADDSEYQEIENLFLEVADQEEEHAEVFLDILNGIGDDIKNLRNSVALEGFVSSIDYPDAAIVADLEGFPEIAQKFRDIAAIEARHRKTFDKYLSQIENGTLLKKSQKSKWMCMKCGFIYEGMEPPEHCPVCEHSRDHFKLYKEE